MRDILMPQIEAARTASRWPAHDRAKRIDVALALRWD
jgi:hypothetical protein